MYPAFCGLEIYKKQEVVRKKWIVTNVTRGVEGFSRSATTFVGVR